VINQIFDTTLQANYNSVPKLKSTIYEPPLSGSQISLCQSPVNFQPSTIMHFHLLAFFAATARALSPSSQRIVEAAAAGKLNLNLTNNAF